MKELLIKAGYSFDSDINVWTRADYTGIAYSDGDLVEQRITNIINDASDLSVLSSELQQHCTDWPSLYHLSSARANILRPFESIIQGDILEIGAGCGAITRYLGECSRGNVLALEGSPRRAAIVRARTRDLQNVTVVAENFERFRYGQLFDVITMIGVLEYANLFINHDEPALGMLSRVKSLLKPDGVFILAIENQLGLKYFAGAPEDHIGQPMYGVEGRYRKNQPQTYGRKVLTKMLEQSGFAHLEFMAPFPDYKLPISIITKKGFSFEGFDASALAWQSVKRDPQLPQILSFSPELVWPSLIKNTVGLDFSNSFLVLVRGSKNQTAESAHLAWHFTSARHKIFCKRTEFLQTPDKTIELRYYPLIPGSSTYIQSNQLTFSIPERAPYVQGKLLSQELTHIVTRDGWQLKELADFFEKYFTFLISYASDKGNPLQINSPESLLPSDYFDLSPQNIIIDRAGTWHVIDKEWRLNTHMTVGWLLFRSLLSLLYSITRFGACADEDINTPIRFIETVFKTIGFNVSEEQILSYATLELAVQEEISGIKLGINKFFEWLQNATLQRTNLHQALAERDAQITSLNQALAEQDAQITSLNQALAEQDARITAILNSKSWSLTSPVRALGALLRKPRKLWWVYRELRKQHTIGGLVVRAVRVWRHEGLSGLKQRAVVRYWIERHPAASIIPASMVSDYVADENAPSVITAAFHQQFRNLSLVDYDVISFDVFDTALVRLVRQPTDVFRYIEQTHQLSGFYQWRIEREADERRLQPLARDINLNDIYRDHPEWLSLEVAAERVLCVANPEVFELYRKAVVLKKRIYFVSDIYLRHEDIEQLLEDAGYHQRDGLLVSSTDRLIKGDGSRFRDLQRAWSGLRVLHVGDNRLADVEWPKKLGFDAFHYQEPDDFFVHDALLSGFASELKAATLSGSPSSLRLSHLLGGYRYWKLGIERSVPSSVWRSVGFLFAGPLLFGFVQFLREQLAAMPSLSRVYFLARDGDIMKQVFDRVYDSEGYDSHYLYASRRCMTFPLLALDDVPDEVLALYSYCDAHTDAEAIFKRFDYPELTEFQHDLVKLEQEQSLTSCNVKRLIKQHRSSIVVLAEQERDNLLGYLQSIGWFEADALVVDVGWNGSIQDDLQLLTEHLPNRVHGAYLGVWPHAKIQDNKSGYLFSPHLPELASRLQPFVDFIELLTSSPLESVKNIACDDHGQFYPCYFAATEEEKKRQAASLEIQSGVMEYVNWALSSRVTPLLPLPVEEFVYLCELLRDQASPELQANFNALRHSRMVNGGHDYVIVPFRGANS